VSAGSGPRRIPGRFRCGRPQRVEFCANTVSFGKRSRSSQLCSVEVIKEDHVAFVSDRGLILRGAAVADARPTVSYSWSRSCCASVSASSRLRAHCCAWSTWYAHAYGTKHAPEPTSRRALTLGVSPMRCRSESVVGQFESPARPPGSDPSGYVETMPKRKSRGTGRDYTHAGGPGGPPGKKQRRKVRRNNKGNRA
jgi:hypothetical protein